MIHLTVLHKLVNFKIFIIYEKYKIETKNQLKTLCWKKVFYLNSVSK